MSLPDFTTISMEAVPVSTGVPVGSTMVYYTISPPGARGASTGTATEFPTVFRVSRPVLGVSVE